MTKKDTEILPVVHPRFLELLLHCGEHLVAGDHAIDEFYGFIGLYEDAIAKLPQIKDTLRACLSVVRKQRNWLQGGEPWLAGDELVNVQHIWDKDNLELYVRHLQELEAKLQEELP